MIEEMATLRITEGELARDTLAVLAQVQAGVEVIAEQDHRPVAVIKTPQRPGRKISECMALTKDMKPSVTRPVSELLAALDQSANSEPRPKGAVAGPFSTSS